MAASDSYINLKRKINSYIDPFKGDTGAKKGLDYFMIALILLNTLAVILQTEDSLEDKYGHYFYYFEIFSIVIFSVEYLLRIWCITLNPKFAHPVLGRLKYIFTKMALIDLLSILPFYVGSIIPFDLRFLRMFRLFRFIRFAKLGRYSNSLKLLSRVFKDKKEDLLMTCYLAVFCILISSCLIYITEHDAQPQKFPSIPGCMYWTMITLTTVGHGYDDVYPITFWGKFVTIFVIFLGLAIISIPTGILASGFYEKMEEKGKKCPHCGKEI